MMVSSHLGVLVDIAVNWVGSGCRESALAALFSKPFLYCILYWSPNNLMKAFFLGEQEGLAPTEFY